MTDHASSTAAALEAALGVAGADEPGEDIGRDHVDRLEAAAAFLTNDTGNGQRLRHWFGDDLLHIRDIGWHVWTGKVWEPLGADEAVQRLAQDAARFISAEAHVIRPDDGYERDALARFETARANRADDPAGWQEAMTEHKALANFWGGLKAKRRGFSLTSGNGARLGNMISAAACHLTVGVEDMDADPLQFNVLNGTLRFTLEADPDCPDPNVVRKIATVALHPHRRADRLAKLAPVTYDPAAACPKWVAFLERFQPSKAMRDFLQTYFGYALLGSIGAQKIVFMYGDGANGKSTAVEALARLLGPYARMLNAESLVGTNGKSAGAATPDLAQLPGARFVRISELPRGERLRESLVKQLTGGEPMMVRHNFGNFFEFHPVFKAVMSGNDKPEIGGLDLGIWRRLALVHWAVTIPEAERRDMVEVLAEFDAEGSGILNWLIAGALRYLTEGLRVPPEIQAFTDELRAERDPVQNFIDACINRTGNDNDIVTSGTLHQAYESWALANADKVWSNRAFSDAMVRKGFRKTEGRLRTFHGLTLHDVPPRPEAPAGSRF